MTTVTVLTGGSTPERDVALAGANQVVQALRNRGHLVHVVDTVHGFLDRDAEARLLVSSVGKAPPDPDALRALRDHELGPEFLELPAMQEADVIFPVLHGREGEGGEIQALLDLAGRCYAGSGPVGSALAMDKDVAKRLFRDAGIPTPPWHMWPADAAATAALGLPLIVKPSKAGSTVGLSVIHDLAELDGAVAAAQLVDDEIMMEQFLAGNEYTVGVLGDDPLAVGEIIPSHEIFDYECKYTPGMTREVFPAELPEGVAAELRALALAAHRVLKLRDFSRIDFRMDALGAPYCLEANTLPGLTATSLLPQSAAAAGIPFDELCDRICALALRRAPARNKVTSRGM